VVTTLGDQAGAMEAGGGDDEETDFEEQPDTIPQHGSRIPSISFLRMVRIEVVRL
jgi:hypothetical protein